MGIRTAALLLLVLLAPVAGADRASADGIGDEVERVGRAHAKGGAEAVAAELATLRFDPWMLVERLAVEGAHDAARAVAEAARPPALYAALPDYATWRRGHPLDAQVLRRLDDAQDLARAGGFEVALAATSVLLDATNGVTRVQALRVVAALRAKTGAAPATTAAAHEAAAVAAAELSWSLAALREYERALGAALKDPETVTRLARVALPLARDPAFTPFELHMSLAAARAHRARGRHVEAMRLAERALELAHDVPARRDALRAVLMSLMRLRRPQEARRRTLALQQLERELGNEHGGMACEVHLATIDASVGRLTAALARIERALAWFEEHGTAYERRGAALNAAQIWLHLRNPARTLELVARVREEERGAEYGGAAPDLLEAAAHLVAGRPEDSAAAYRSALAHMDGEAVSQRISAHLAYAVVLAGLDRHDDARAQMRTARSLLDEQASDLTRMHVETTDCLVRLERGDVAGAIGAGEAARARVRPELAGQWAALLETRLARARLASGEPHRALEHAERAIEIVLRHSAALPDQVGAQHRAELSASFAVGMRAAAALDDLPAMFRLAEQERAVALRTRLHAEDLVDRTLDPTLRAQELDLEEAESLAMQHYRSALEEATPDAVRARYADLSVARERLERHRERLRAEQVLAGHALHPEVDALDAVRAGLAPDEALVVYAGDLAVLWALVITQDGVRRVRLGEVEPVGSRVRTSALEDPLVPAMSELEALRRLLVEPLALPRAARRVHIVPFGDLAWIPFPALLAGREVSLLPSATVGRLLRERPAVPGTRVLAVAESAGALGAALPGARAEAAAVGDVVLLGDDATEDRVRRALREGPWRSVHVACHGLVDPVRPLRSALSLEPSEGRDGLWTVAEILGASVHTDLVALSACSTGRDRVFRQEGGVGFVHAFFVSGAREVLVSLWNVDDRATAELMARFYAAWTPGSSAARALARAQADLRADPRWAHPAYWAGWVLWGVP